MNKDDFKNVAESLRFYHRITDKKLKEINGSSKISIEQLYVDLLPNDEILKNILEKRTTFLVGRKGTGKSTIFARAQSQIHKEKKNLSVYINAKTIYKESSLSLINISDCEQYLTYNDRLQITLIKNIINALLTGLIEELKNEKKSILQYFKKNSDIGRINILITEITEITNSFTYENITKIMSISNESNFKEQANSEVSFKVESMPSLSGSISKNMENSNKNSNREVWVRDFKVDKIINKFLQVLDICKRESIYIFVDDYSELGFKEREIFMDTIIEPMYEIGVDKLFFKVACYPNRILPINLPNTKYFIRSIDLYDIYGEGNNITDTERMAIDYTEKLLKNRFKIYCMEEIEEYFDLSTHSMRDYYKILYESSMNVPRVLGNVLYNCYSKSIIYNKKNTMAVINDAIKQYYIQNTDIIFKGQNNIKYDDTDSKVNIFVQENIKNELVKCAQKNKYDLPKSGNNAFENLKEAYSSHFTLSIDFEMFIEDLEFNGFVHKINKIASKGKKSTEYKNSNNYLYALDLGLCLNEKILYGRPENSNTKYFQQRVFIYDDIILNAINSNKVIKCKSCGATYSIDQLEVFKRFKMKCQECDNGICEIVYDKKLIEKAQDENKHAIWNQQEFDIINTIYKLSQQNEDNISANLISKEVDYSPQLIGHICRILHSSGYVERNKESENTPYNYGVSSRAKNIIKTLY